MKCDSQFPDSHHAAQGEGLRPGGARDPQVRLQLAIRLGLLGGHTRQQPIIYIIYIIIVKS